MICSQIIKAIEEFSNRKPRKLLGRKMYFPAPITEQMWKNMIILWSRLLKFAKCKILVLFETMHSGVRKEYRAPIPIPIFGHFQACNGKRIETKQVKFMGERTFMFTLWTFISTRRTCFTAFDHVPTFLACALWTVPAPFRKLLKQEIIS